MIAIRSPSSSASSMECVGQLATNEVCLLTWCGAEEFLAWINGILLPWSSGVGSLAGEVGHDGKSRHSVARLCVAECGIDLQQFNITPGLLPKSLHTLNLSRNKISTIEGLRELTRMRVLDLSYNRISRIGQSSGLELNKDAVKPQRAREMLTDSVAKAALGNSSRTI
ncbi:hypothetical protein KIW84_021360 [Lathyrus oleraceus]|uniref:Uncharacterized protein n=1 Tax=Pisum sativum TaxID=3888 RepID=A0A9D5B5A9_PEA|nr:hypothetical protein KIW84_021360 [Pisum sativum]